MPTCSLELADVHGIWYVHVNVNTAQSMNKHNRTSAEFERGVAARLEQLLSGVGWLRSWRIEQASTASDCGCDLLATLPLPRGGKAILCVDCRRELRPSTFGMLTAKTPQLPGRPKALIRVLGMPWVSPRIAELCAEHGWSWIDLAGNHHIDIPGAAHLERTGNKPTQTHNRPLANFGTPEAARVMRVLLAPQHVATKWTQRDIQQRCEPAVSLGLVNKVVRRLLDEAYLQPDAKRGFKLSDPRRLLTAWRDSYRFDRHVRHNYFSLLRDRPLRDALAQMSSADTVHAAYAAFSAAEILAPHVRQSRIWLYLSAAAQERFCELVEAKPVDSGENIVVLLPSDNGVFYMADRGGAADRLACTNAVQTYVDLGHCGGRGEEAAEAVLNQRLAPVWREQGLAA